MSRPDRLLDLLASRATEGALSDEESTELVKLALREQTDVEVDDLELAAASVDLAYHAAVHDREPMPAHLRGRILEAFDRQTSQRPSNVSRFPERPQSRPSLLGGRYLGWYAAAAMLILSVWAPWSPGPEQPVAVPTVAEQRETLVQTAADVIQVAWATPEVPEFARVSGDVVWSNRRQSGFMRLRGLPPNRSRVEQYQLWIVDPTRDERPIDGGVFDIPRDAEEIIVPIDAKIRVDDPQVFAITLEQSGGVVVSDGPLLVVAPVRT